MFHVLEYKRLPPRSLPSLKYSKLGLGVQSGICRNTSFKSCSHRKLHSSKKWWKVEFLVASHIVYWLSSGLWLTRRRLVRRWIKQQFTTVSIVLLRHASRVAVRNATLIFDSWNCKSFVECWILFILQTLHVFVKLWFWRKQFCMDTIDWADCSKSRKCEM